MKHFSEGNQEEVPYDYNILSSKHREDYSDYDKSMFSHSSDEDFIHRVMMEVESDIFKNDFK